MTTIYKPTSVYPAYSENSSVLSRLREQPVLNETVVTHLLNQQDHLSDCGHPDPPQVDSFYRGQIDLDEYYKAQAWWPAGNDVPSHRRCPSLVQLCYMYHEPALGLTFHQRLIDFAELAAPFVKPAKRPPGRPRTNPLPDKAREERIRVAYQTYMDACQNRKKVDAENKKLCQDLYATWQFIKAGYEPLDDSQILRNSTILQIGQRTGEQPSNEGSS